MKKTFTGNTRLFLCISGAIIVIALVMQIAGVGLNLGIDFTGGSILNYSVGEDYDVSDVETLLNASGYTDNQITKAAPSAASIALQAELAAEADKAVEEVSEAAAADPEVAEAVDAAVDAAVEEAAVEAAVEEAVTPTLGLLNPDKSNIAHDGLTDLQIRLKLADATEGMEDVIKGAVVGVVSSANETSYRTATNQEISTLGYALSYAGGNIVEFDMAGTFDKAAVEELSTIPSKEELIARFMGSIQSPMASFARVLTAIVDERGGAPAEA
jgi:ribosomal protein L10